MARRLAVRLYGMGSEDGVASNWKVSVRARESLEIAMVCSKSPPQ